MGVVRWRMILAAAGLSAMMLGGFSGLARADITAVTETRTANGDLDLVREDISTLERLPLPAGINTAADELHPSLSPDGTKLAFERVDPQAGTTRFIVVDLATGTSVDLLNAFQVATSGANDPTFIGQTKVALGGPLVAFPPGFIARYRTADISEFPQPPALGEFFAATFSGGASGRALQIDEHTHQVTGVRFDGDPRGAIASGIGDSHARALLQGTASFDDPTVSTSDNVVVVEKRPVSGSFVGDGTLVFTNTSLTAAPIALPAIVNGPGGAAHPEFSDDGRYLAFVGTKDNGDQLRVWDTQSQTMVIPAGFEIPLGHHDISSARGQLWRTDGAITLHIDRIIISSAIFASGLITVRLTTPSTVGIVVQKVIGQTRVLGHAAPKLRFIGRVPLGHYGKGARHIRWNRTVGGHRLAPGLYQVTPRSVTARGGVRDLGRPVIIRIRPR